MLSPSRPGCALSPLTRLFPILHPLRPPSSQRMQPCVIRHDLCFLPRWRCTRDPCAHLHKGAYELRPGNIRAATVPEPYTRVRARTRVSIKVPLIFSGLHIVAHPCEYSLNTPLTCPLFRPFFLSLHPFLAPVPRVY